MGRFILGIIIGLVLAPCIVLGWFKWGNPPVAVADKPLPFERQIVHMPMHVRIDREMVSTPPIQPDEQNLVSGAEIYRDDCASCHGMHGQPSPYAAHMYPKAPQLWEKHHNGNVGVGDDPAGETYWKVANGIRLTGMPAFDKILSGTQMWQVTLLLANADKPLPPEAVGILNSQAPAEPVAATHEKK